MDIHDLAHRVSVRLARFDLAGLKQLIEDMGPDTLIPVKLHTINSGLELPLKQAIYQAATFNYLADSALNALIKGLHIPIDMPSPLNDFVLEVEQLNLMGLPNGDQGYWQEGELALDLTLATLRRVEIEARFRRTKLIKHVRTHASPSTFFAALTHKASLDEVLFGIKKVDDRHAIRSRLMSRLPWVIRKAEHLKDISVREVVERAGLLSPSNPERFLFWAGMFEQLHSDDGVSPVASMFLDYLLEYALCTDPAGCLEILRHTRWDAVVTSNHAMALDVFHARLAASSLSWIQDDITFQINFALRNLKTLADDDYGVLPHRMQMWRRSFIDHTHQVIIELMSAFIAEPINRHVHNYWLLIQELLDRGFTSNEELDPSLYPVYEHHLLCSSGNTPDYPQCQATANYCNFTYYDQDIDEHLTELKALFGL